MPHVSRSRVYNYGGGILKSGDIVAVKYVTVIGRDRDFVVYWGNSSQSDQDIADYGDKVSVKEGRAVAPYCSHLRYRD